MKTKSNKCIVAKVIKVIDISTSKVLIEDRIFNTKYSKYYKHSRKLLVDNNGINILINDIVSIVSTKPLSKNKSWLICEKMKNNTENVLQEISEEELA